MGMQLRQTDVDENWQESSPHREYSMTDITKLMRPHLVKVATYHGVDPSEELARSAGIKPEEVIRLNVWRARRGACCAFQHQDSPVPGS